MSGNMSKCFFKVKSVVADRVHRVQHFSHLTFCYAILQSVRSGSMHMKNIYCVLCNTYRDSNLCVYISVK